MARFPEDEGDLLHDRFRHDEGQTFPHSAPFWLCGGGAAFFGLIPLLFLVSWQSATCDGGPPIAAYALGACGAAAVGLVDVLFVLRRWPSDWDWPGLSGGWLKVMAGTCFDWPLVVSLLGKADFYDLVTDVVQVGQVQACEKEQAFVQQYRAAWRGYPVLGSSAKLSSFFIICFGISYVSQLGLYVGSFVKVLFSGLHRGFQLSSRAYAGMAEALGAFGATLASRCCREAAADVDGDDNYFRPHGDSVRLQVNSQSTYARVLLEAVPSLYLSIAFLALSFDHLNTFGKVKQLAAVAFTCGTCGVKAIELIQGALTSMEYVISSAIKAFFLAGVISLWLVIMSVKLLGVFVCTSHQLNVLVMQCVPKVD